MKSNRESNLRYKNSWIDFKDDGIYSKERIKGRDKRILAKWSRKKVRKELSKEVEDNMEEQIGG